MHYFTLCGGPNAAQMNMHHSLNSELMLYKSELGHNAAEATKNICFVKGEVQ